jgi:low temperature requirement protein LtrA
MAETLFRERTDESAEVSPIELFFDLVFVFAITQISHFLLHHLDWLGAVEAALLLLAIWSAWGDTVLVTNLLEPRSRGVRTTLFVLMAVGLVLSSAIPDAFAERGLVFAIAFVLFQLGRTLFMLYATRSRAALFSNFLRASIWVAVYSALWIGGAFLEGELRLAAWALALLLDYGGSAIGFPVPGMGRTATRDLTVGGAHLAERISLFIMIALGESVLVTGTQFAALDWTPAVVAAMASALLQSMAMWWIYFYWTADMAKAVVIRAEDPANIALRAFGYVPWLLVAGIVVGAVGDELLIAHPEGHAEPSAAWVLIGGPALFLLGAVLFAYGAFGKWATVRIGALLATLALAAIVPFVSPLILSAMSTGILVVMAAIEGVVVARKQRRHEVPQP